MKEILTGISEFFTSKGCYVHHFLDDEQPYLKIRGHRIKGFVEAQVFEDFLYLLYRHSEPEYEPHSWRRRNPGSQRIPLKSYDLARKFDLKEPQSLPAANQYVRKHLFPAKARLRGGLGDKAADVRL